MDRPPAHQLIGSLARLRADAVAIAGAGVAAVSPRVLVPAALGDLTSAVLAPVAVHVLAVGKAAAAMLAAFAAVSPWPMARALAIGPRRPAEWPADWTFVEGGHPFASAGSVLGARLALELAAEVPPDGHLVCLLSGGASALMASPRAGLTLATKQRVVAQVMHAGGDIAALNAVRKHLSAIKGGRLAAACGGDVTTLAISDVIGDDLSVIGSGPCVPDASTWADAREVLGRFAGVAAIDPQVAALVEAGCAGGIEETPKPGDARLSRSSARVIGGRAQAMAGAAAAAERLAYPAVVIDAPVFGEAREAARAWWGRVGEQVVHGRRPMAVVSSGETTVSVRGNGRGGRNQEFALALVDAVAGVPHPLALVSIGTDGIDGPTDAAGAAVDPSTRARAGALALAPAAAYLEQNDSSAYFEALGDLVRTGPSDTNVGDLQVLLVGGD